MPSTQLRPLLIMLAAAAALASAPDTAAADQEFTAASAKHFFNGRGCNACHGLDEQRIGPPYQVVAARYAAAYAADPADQIERLAVKIRYGGAGAWGAVPMVSNPTLSDDEARAIAKWILVQIPAR